MRVNNLMKNFGFTGTNKEISVRVRSDLKNIIKQAMSSVQDYKESLDLENEIDIKEGVKNE